MGNIFEKMEQAIIDGDEELCASLAQKTIDEGIDKPKYLVESVLEFPSSVISALIMETRYLFKNSVFEIVAHALNIHREDIKSDQKLNRIIERSHDNMNVNVEELYYNRVKTIYGEIIRYATTAQSKLKLSKNIKQDIKAKQFIAIKDIV